MQDGRKLPFIFVSHSPEKVAEVENILGVTLERRSIDLPEIQAVEVADVVGIKAQVAYSQLENQAVMIEDTGLYFEAWNGLPGALITWFLERMGPDGICQMMSSFSDRRAYAEAIVATYDGELRVFSGRVEGRVAVRPAGERGFGWDSIFIPESADKTFAEMTVSEKNDYSMRRLAFQKLLSYYSLDTRGDSNA